MKQSNLKVLLSNRNFMLLWADQILSNISYNFVNFGLLVWVYELTRSNFAVSLLILTIIIPTAVFSIFTGVISDFFDKRRVMFIIDVLWASLVLGFVLIKDNILAILTLSFIINSVDRFFTPAEQASLPSVVRRKDLLFANSLFGIASNATIVLGISMAGPLMLLFGNDSPFIVAAISTYLGAICVYFLPSIRSHVTTKSAVKLILDDTLSAIKIGGDFILSKRAILTAIIFLTVIQTCMNIGASLGPGYAEGTLGIDVKHASLIFAFPVGIGFSLGIYFMNLWNGKILKRQIVQRGLFLGSIGLLLVGFGPLMSDILLSRTSHLYLIRPLSHLLSLSGLTFIAAFLMGMSIVFISVPTTTSLSENIPKELQGRVWGVANMFQYAFASLPLLLIGAIADRISVLPLIFIMVVLAIITYFLTRKKSFERFFFS